jgi:phosphatidate cytidylyltransferase
VGRHSAAPEDDPGADETGPAQLPVEASAVEAVTVPGNWADPARAASADPVRATSGDPALSDTGHHDFEARSDLAVGGSRSEPAGRDLAHGSVAVLTQAEFESESSFTAGEPASIDSGPPAKSSRAGRNLPAAIGVSLALGAVIIASLLLYRPSFVAIVCIAMAYGSYEMVRAIGAAEARPPLVPLVAGGVAMDVAAWYQGANALVLGLLLTVLGVTVWRLAEGAVGYARDVTSAAFIALYVPLLGGFAVLLTHYSDGAGRVIAFIATVVCSDVGGYTAGVLFGRHPMAPTISPKKSWEGFVGSAIACSIGGALFMSLLFHHRWWIGVLYGLAIAVTATLGDLGESMVKRDLGVKDMGRLLPGHGGLMDRLDSLLPCAAVAYLIMAAALG